MTERVGESALAVNAPRDLVIGDPIRRAVRARRDSAGNERIRVIAEHLDPRRD